MNYTTNAKKVLLKTGLTLKLLNFENATDEVLKYIINIEEENQNITIEQKIDEIFNIVKDTYADNVGEKTFEELEPYFSSMFEQVSGSEEIGKTYGTFLAVYYTSIVDMSANVSDKLEALKVVDYEILPELCESRLAIESILLDLLLTVRPIDMEQVEKVNEDMKRLLEL